jgi:hypothetical protein
MFDNSILSGKKPSKKIKVIHTTLVAKGRKAK